MVEAFVEQIPSTENDEKPANLTSSTSGSPNPTSEGEDGIDDVPFHPTGIHYDPNDLNNPYNSLYLEALRRVGVTIRNN